MAELSLRPFAWRKVLEEELSAALGEHGLILRGASEASEEDDLPSGPSGLPAKSLLLIGNAGAAHWPHFCAWRAKQPENVPDPLDAWTRAVVEPIAARFGARAAFPFDRPFPPFQRWAMRTEGLRPSPLGILMHPEYGLWHAYRAALLFDREISVRAPRTAVHLCDACAAKPCLSACPAGAYSEAGFGHAACLSHVRSDRGELCRADGCLARNACPAGTAYRYPPQVQAFHQAAFARL